MSVSTGGQVLEATEGFVTEIDGERYIVNRKLTRIDSSHVLNQHYPQHFQPVADHLTYQAEAADANPGEQRERHVPSPPAEAPKTPDVKASTPPTTPRKR